MIINFHFLQHSLLEHDYLISCKYFVTIMISSDYNRIPLVLKFCWKIITSLP